MQVLALAVVVVAVSACAKSNESSASSAQPAASAAASVAAVSQNGVESNAGGKVYQTNCSSCHQATGAGVEGSFPPLAANAVVTGDPKTLIHIVKYGLSGKITVAGQTYNGVMPNWGQSMSNADIAAALTYIRSSWGNKASAISEAEVTAVSQ